MPPTASFVDLAR